MLLHRAPGPAGAGQRSRADRLRRHGRAGPGAGRRDCRERRQRRGGRALRRLPRPGRARQGARRRHAPRSSTTTGGCSTTGPSTRSSSPRPTTGTAGWRIDAVVGRQGRLHREADDLHGRRGPRDHRRRRSAQADPPGRQPGRQRRAAGGGARAGQVRAARRDHHDPRLEPPQLRQRRVALPDSARRLAADGGLEAVPRPGAAEAVRPRALLPLALLLGLLRRPRHRPVRPPPQLDPLRDGRPGAVAHSGRGRHVRPQDDARSARHAGRHADLSRRASPCSSRAR